MNIYHLILFCTLISRFGAPSLSNDNPVSLSINVAEHQLWDSLLQKHVDLKGNVDYKNFAEDIQLLDRYLLASATNPPMEDWSRNKRLAYYINLYNAATVKLVLDNYPIVSIKDINRPWDKKWIKVGNQVLSLGEIEHQILRKMNEPRIHFAINCASYSCPKLLNTAYTPANVDKLLEQATNDFIRDPSRNNITKNKLLLSPIFKWYRRDFTVGRTLVQYINTYTDIPIEANAKIEFLNYDWSLNETR